MGGRYVSGFNEEGFQVTLLDTDLQTGETLSPDGIGGDRDPNACHLQRRQVRTAHVKRLITASFAGQEIRDNPSRPGTAGREQWIAPMPR